jgi:multicomponent Na+:H+ antiporter subunit D
VARLLVIMPVVLPLLGAALCVLSYRRHRIHRATALGAMLISLASSFALLFEVWHGERPLVFQLGGWPAPFGITVVGDLLSAVMTVMSQLVLTLGVVYSLGSKEQCVRYHFYLPLFLTLTTGLTGCMLTGDIFNFFVFAEVLVVSAAALTAISDDRYGAEAAFKYFYISQIAAACLLVAVGCLYVAYGTLNMADLSVRMAAGPVAPLQTVAMVALLVAFAIKSAIVPFHYWQPDFHAAAPTAVSAVLSSVVVKVGVYGLIRMRTLLFAGHDDALPAVLMVLGAAGLVLGGLAATGTHHLKRLLAYSTLGQIGFIVIAIGWGTAAGLAAAVLHSFNHSLIKSALLMLAGAVASRARIKSASFDVIQGMGRFMPVAGVLFLLGAMALAGLPPLNGFISKLALFRGGLAIDAHLSLAVFVVGSFLSLFYVVRAYQRVWWDEPGPETSAKPEGDRLFAPAILIGLCVALGVWAEPLWALATDTATWLGAPQLYVEAVLGK